jgi:hypothetical protein
MEIKMKLVSSSIMTKIEDLDKNPELCVFSSCQDLIASFRGKTKMYDGTIFNISIECGEGSFIQYEIKIDDLELFATSILKSIEIVRRDYSEHIKYQTNNCYCV